MTPAERLVSRTTEKDGCWLWQGAKNSMGYPNTYFQKRYWLAHRLLYTLTHRPLEPGELLCHKCDNPACINPEHMFVGSQLDNMRDMATKGRRACGASHGERIKAGWTDAARKKRGAQTTQRAKDQLAAAQQNAGVSSEHFRCYKCGEWKLRDKMSKSKSRTPHVCKLCRSAHKI